MNYYWKGFSRIIIIIIKKKRKEKKKDLEIAVNGSNSYSSFSVVLTENLLATKGNHVGYGNTFSIRHP